MRSASLRSQAGYTVLETVVALGIGGFLMAGSAAMVDGGLARWRVRAAANDVATSLAAARARAAILGVEVAVLFDESAGEFKLAATETLSPSAEVRAEVVRGAAGAVRRLPGDVTFVAPTGADPVTAAPPGSSDPAALFDPRGMLLSDLSPVYVHVGSTRARTYRRVRASRIGTITIELWDGTRWR